MKINPATFIDHNKNTIQLIIDEADAIVQSGQTGAHSDQARRNLLLGQALLGILQILKDGALASRSAKTVVEKATNPNSPATPAA